MGSSATGWTERRARPRALALVVLSLAAALALATVACTGQIYPSLETIPRWHQPTTTPIYLALSLATGGLLLTALLALLGMPIRPVAIVTLVVLVLAAVLKIVYWRSIDGRKRRYSIEAATGLGAFGSVRVLDPPHTQPNYVMREMGYAVGRRHARRLRLLTLACLFAIPVALTLLGLASPGLPATVAAGLAVASASLGVLTERWLFFAEAEHVVMLYYGADAA